MMDVQDAKLKILQRRVTICWLFRIQNCQLFTQVQTLSHETLCGVKCPDT